MSESKLFGGTYKFKNQRLVGVELLEPDTRLHVKIDSGPRFDRYTARLVLGNSPNGNIVKDKLNASLAFKEILDDGRPVDFTWLISGAQSYVFIMDRRLDTLRPEVTVVTTLAVFTDKAGKTYVVHP